MAAIRAQTPVTPVYDQKRARQKRLPCFQAVNSRLGGALAMCTVDLIAYSASIYFGWQMALVAIPVFAPVYIAFGFKAKFLRRKALQDEKEMEDCGRVNFLRFVYSNPIRFRWKP